MHNSSSGSATKSLFSTTTSTAQRPPLLTSVTSMKSLRLTPH
jgi:hypothetical protein